METISLTIDGEQVRIAAGSSILSACQKANIYVPTLCSHPDLSPPFDLAPSDFIFRGNQKIENADPSSRRYPGCRLCLVQVQGEDRPVRACATEALNGQIISTNTDKVNLKRQENLSSILANHPHACLTCAQNRGCSLEPCTNNVAVVERCCPKFNRCEIQKVAEFIGISRETPRYTFRNLPVVKGEPLYAIDYNLCIGCLRCVQICREQRGVGALGFVFQNGEVLVGTIAPTLKDSGCKFCGACVEVCPTGTLLDKAIKGIPTERDLVPCISACPVGMDVPGYVTAIAERDLSRARKIIKEKAPFPRVLSRVCFHPCEQECRRSFLNEPVAICALKRFAFESGSEEEEEEKVSRTTGRKVAVVGAGPAGLTAAYYLARSGHSVAVFESGAEPGGMLRYGIPDFRLPRALVAKEISQILKQGIELRTNTVFGRDITLETLQPNFDALFLAFGAQGSKKLKLEGIDREGVLWGLDFLRKVKSGERIRLKDKVAVIGGGDVAIDVAMTALRLNAQEVHLFCLEERDRMPAHPWQIEQALDEGVVIHCSWGPKRIVGDGNQVAGVELVKCLSVFEQDGTFQPAFDESQGIFQEAGSIIFAIGQTLDASIFVDGISRRLVQDGKIRIKPDTLETSLSGVFAGGDAVSGPASVVEAIQMGRRAAVAIDKFLGGEGRLEGKAGEEKRTASRDHPGWLGREDGFAGYSRIPIPTPPAEQRKKSFAELECGYDLEHGVKEAQRCLRCHLRLQISRIGLPPEKHLEFTEGKIKTIPDIEGVFQLLDTNRKVILISGTSHLRESLHGELKTRKQAAYFIFEENKMYTQRETELLQQFLQRYGKLPEGNDEVGDLY